MSKITQSKAARCIMKGKKVLDIKPTAPRKEIKCDSCGRKYLVSVGQIKKCYHGSAYETSRRKQTYHEENI